MESGKNKRGSSAVHASGSETTSTATSSKAPQTMTTTAANAAVTAGNKPAGDGRDIGRALRTVYDRALEEMIPPEMLDLLGKLD